MSNNCLNQITAENLLADTHCHLDFEQYKITYGVLFKRAQEINLKEIWLVSTNYSSILANIELVKRWQRLFPKLKLRLGIGFDPEIFVPGSDLFDMNWFSLDENTLLVKLAQMYKGIEEAVKKEELEIDLIGEIGMDFYWLEKNYQESLNDPDLASEKGVMISTSDKLKSEKLQEILFRFQLEYAAKNNLPVSIHSRGAETECAEIISEYKKKYPKFNGIFHSFTGNVLQMKQIFNLDFSVGLNGIVTYNSAARLLEAVLRRIKKSSKFKELIEQEGALRKLSLEQKLDILYQAGFVLETDAPYLIPSNTNSGDLKQVFGDRLNEPASVADTIEFIFNKLA